MPLINCPECGKEIFYKSHKCIYCGYNIKKHLKGENKSKGSKRIDINVIKMVVPLIIIFIGILVTGYVLKSKMIPSVINLSVDEAEQILSQKGIKYDIVEEYTYEHDDGVVFSQGNSEHKLYSKGDVVNLYVSVGRKYDIPNIIGKSIGEIATDLKEDLDGIKIEYIYELTDDYIYSIIYKTEPAVGSSIDEGEVLTVYVSGGKYLQIDELTGKTLEEAKRILKVNGLEYKIVEEFTSEPENTVVSYTPQKIAPSDTTVTLNVSVGEGILVYDYGHSGTELDVALQRLKDSGFTNITHRIVYNDMKIDCKETTCTKVVEQRPAGLIKNDKKQEIVLDVSVPAIAITGIDWDINSVGGVNTYIKFKNTSDKQIAYVTFEMKYYDRMGNPAQCTIKKKSTASLQYTGPLDAGKTKGNNLYWDAVIYNNTVAVLQPLSAEVEFSDGTKQKLTYTGRYWYSKNYYGGELKD